MIFDRIAVLRSVFGSNDRAAANVARRWRRAFQQDDDLAADVARLGGVMVAEPVEMVDGLPQAAPIDPYRLAYEAGKRDLALLLLAQGGISYDELNQLMEANEP
ncbi:hypothetical protein SAMN05444007_108247 [Cribrihabitans marinus]|uniref:Uncharacterized protein n=1 Tax=Cribrihabitans marinus TaxID=1227549 RepID=A0A1H7CXU9_9RHOB|nr:hypothetical protein [Cribrihabitans marinus]GGH36311.1 hypothetical protein GCM10010973_30170 [Cribrihabitans marinus]SEJ91560.1 hypothetical protein SAMN05444007_108247 [Cribrihabitans marinus]